MRFIFLKISLTFDINRLAIIKTLCLFAKQNIKKDDYNKYKLVVAK